MTSLVVVCGLAAEAKIAAVPNVIAGGGDGARLAARLAALPADLPALLSFGVAGGLDPLLRPGAARVASGVVYGSDLIEADAAWAEKIASATSTPTTLFAGSDAVLADGASKAALHASAGAALVDMETHIVAGEARRRRIPWAAIRAITDPADRTLPHAAVVGMKLDGSIDLPAILKSLARNPGQLPDLIRAGADARAAFAALLRCRQALGPGFGLAGLDL